MSLTDERFAELREMDAKLNDPNGTGMTVGEINLMMIALAEGAHELIDEVDQLRAAAKTLLDCVHDAKTPFAVTDQAWHALANLAGATAASSSERRNVIADGPARDWTPEADHG